MIDCISSNGGTFLIKKKKTRAQAQRAGSVECLECICLFVNAFCNGVVAIYRENVLYVREKNFHVALKENFPQFCAIMPFWGNYALRAELCDIASACNSGSPV